MDQNLPPEEPVEGAAHSEGLNMNLDDIVSAWNDFAVDIPDELPDASPSNSARTKPVDDWRETGLYSIKLLEGIQQDASPWIVENLIREGDQVVLSGPPKSGKTILALQLALDVALGNPYFLIPERYKIPEKKRVLFLSLEMRQRAISRRVEKQWQATDEYPDLEFLFKVRVRGSDSHLMFRTGTADDELQITDTATALHRLIKRANPKLIILDSLIQIHALDENSNMKMGMLMRRIRKMFSLVSPSTEEEYENDLPDEVEKIPILEEILPRKSEKEKKYRTIGYNYFRRTPIAHILLHHTRKAAEGMGKNFASPDAIRGASSIHSEADLALTLANAGVNRVSLNKSSRDLSGERTEYFDRKSEDHGKPRLHFAPAPPRDLQKKQCLSQIYYGLKQVKITYADTMIQALTDAGQIKHLTKGEAVTGFRDSFTKKLGGAGLNVQKGGGGAGNFKKIELKDGVSLAEFFEALGLDGSDADDYADAKPLIFKPAEEIDAESTAVSEPTPIEVNLPEPEVKKAGKKGRPKGSKNKKKK
jgi:hypothetical protein